MKRSVLLLILVCLLYLVPSLVLQAVYGPSYGFLSGEDCWRPDGSGGWEPHGSPSGPPPTGPSVEVPIALRYLPLFLPALLMLLFLFTPLARLLESREAVREEEQGEPRTEPTDSADADDKTP